MAPYLLQVMKRLPDGSQAFSHSLQKSSDAPLAVPVLRKGLAGLRDGSAVVIAIGPLTNIRDLLESAPDEQSPLDGKALVAAKVRRLVIMAGDFRKPKAEFNVFSDSEISPTTRQPGSSSRGVDRLGKPAAIGPLNSRAEPFLSSIRWKEDP